LLGGTLYPKPKDFKMAAKVDQTAIEKSHNQSTVSPATTPVRVANSSKISMRAVKAGVSFVIPKNKLSGAMVPVGRGGGKLETNDSKKDEEVKQPQRKTKWGIDLTQDAAVKRGRALAYQVALSDITACLVVQILSRLVRSKLLYSWSRVIWRLTMMKLRDHPHLHQNMIQPGKGQTLGRQGSENNWTWKGVKL